MARDAAARGGALHGIRQRAVGVAAHRDVIVDVDQFAREAAREESGDEQRDVAEALQRALARGGTRRLERFGQHVRQRPDAQALRRLLVQRVGAREHGEQVDDVLLGLLVDVEMLVLARFVKRVTKKFAQGTDRYQRPVSHSLHARHPFAMDRIPSYRLRIRGVKGQSANWSQKMPINSVFFVSAVGVVGCQARRAPRRC